MKLFLVVFLFFICNKPTAQQLRVGLYTTNTPKEFNFSVASGSYLLSAALADQTTRTVKLGALTQGKFKVHGAMIQYFQGGIYLFESAQFELLQLSQEDYCIWSAPELSSKTRSYEGDFELRIVKGALQLINRIDLETYLEGVVSCEGGPGHQKAYYQAQAVISRTYALNNLKRHQKEGFELCERVHCQAYLHKRTGVALIDTAVFQTKSVVLLDAAGQYFPTFFHANCGGQTCEPQDVWNESIIGLASFRDTFCVHTKQATWVKHIPIQNWTAFLVNNYQFPLEDSMSYALLQQFRQPERCAFYLHPVYGIPLRDLREQFKLKSTFFDAVVVGQEIILYGKGFGHGVGLCQEGAIQMAKTGCTYEQILRFYYPKVRISGFLN